MLNAGAKHCRQFLQVSSKSPGKGFTANWSEYLNIPQVKFIHFVLIKTIGTNGVALISAGGSSGWLTELRVYLHQASAERLLMEILLGYMIKKKQQKLKQKAAATNFQYLNHTVAA